MRRIGLLSLLLAGSVACEGGGGTGPRPRPLPVPTALAVTPEEATLADGGTRALTATVTDQTGAVMTTLPAGTTIAWSTRDGSVASVDAAGTVTAQRPGAVWIRATAGTLADSARIVVTAVPAQVAVVGSAARTGTTGRVVADSLAVRVTDRHGSGVGGVTVTFAASGGGLVLPATVQTRADGTARAAWQLGPAAGEQTATATAGGIAGSATFTATAAAPAPATVDLTPDFATIAVGGTQAFTATIRSVDGQVIPGAQATFTTTAAATATVNGAAATGAAPGVARIVARAGTVADTATVAVLGASSVLATALPGGSIDARVQRGDTVRVPVILDVSRPSPTGALGSVQLDVRYDAAMLQFVRADDVLGGTVGNLRAAGRYALAFAAAQPQGTGTLRLATLVLVVRQDAAPAAASTLDVEVVERPRTLDFVELAAPLTVGGRVRIP